ncbi:MAG: hypothetical protein M0P74_00885 [Syntrophales bacterium]|jgi:hypothetical protein|nr:hypothetical protein [Syntrophales bacterium]
MGSATFYPAAVGDDGSVFDDPELYLDEDLYIGDDSGWYAHSFIRFPVVSIPAGSVISSCVVRLVQFNDPQWYRDATGAVVRLNVFFNAANDAVAPTITSEYTSLAKTTGIAWDGLAGWTHGVAYDTPDISAILQEVIDRPGWSDGNAVMVMIENDGSDTSANRSPDSYDAGRVSPALIVTWSAGSDGIEVPVADAHLMEHNPDFGVMSSQVPVATATLLARNPAYIWNVPLSQQGQAKVIYYCILTGANDGVDDVILPISSFQARARDGEPSYLSCVVPDSLSNEAAILARTNGEIIIQKGVRLHDGTEQMEELMRVDYEDVQIHRGAYSDSAIIGGHKTVTSSAPKEWAVSGVSFYGLQSDGKRSIRANMDLFLRPGDTCIYGNGGNDYFTVGMITYWVSAVPATFYMEVQEA